MIKIEDKVQCCGCEACSSICPKNCIEMKIDIEGFLYPLVNEIKCINCNLCEKVCPIINAKKVAEFKQDAYLLQNKNEVHLKQSTSGGAFTPIAEYVINQGGVVFGVAFDDEFNVLHIATENIADLEKFRNSKYVQSRIGDTYRQAKKHLESGELVCFSGTPCQIEGLRSFLRKDYENLILIDVVCRAVPSPNVWNKYFELATTKYGEIKSVRFRDKTLGYQYSTMEIVTENGKVYRDGIESHPWLRMFFSGMIIRPSCTDCKFRNKYRNSDFTIWDCFNIYMIDKSFDETVGTTQMLIQSEKGQKLFEELKQFFKYNLIDTSSAVSGMKELKLGPKENPQKQEFFSDLDNNGLDFALNKYFPTTAKVKIKKYSRLTLNTIGLDRMVKHLRYKIKSLRG
ncbi:MAG: Coenzyme F420 hydrogenase/dehydrogenase, beta subunit C-terminal domain [Clostridia bacterium]